MAELVLNDVLHLTYPEGFHIMTNEELKEMAFVQKGPGECLFDPARHMMISFGWRKGSGFSYIRLKAKEIAHHDEKLVRQSMWKDRYSFECFSSRTIGGEQAEGFCYNYQDQKHNMSAESIVLKHNKFFYYFHVHTRSSVRGENLALWEDMLRNMHF